jgi:hypothetical protein
MNEYVHDATDQDILGLIVECTGGEEDSGATKYTLFTLNMLRMISDFDSEDTSDIENSGGLNTQSFTPNQAMQSLPQISAPQSTSTGKGINLSYTINLN